MTLDDHIKQLEKNKTIFFSLLNDATENEYLFRAEPNQWNMLEIICHLLDEEREDFKTRLHNVLNTPELAPPSIAPVEWVKSRDYVNQNFEETTIQFLLERDKSISYLSELKDAKWENGYEYGNYGRVTGRFFLSNWLAHDYLHIRQITRLKYDYLAKSSGISIDYAGTWK